MQPCGLQCFSFWYGGVDNGVKKAKFVIAALTLVGVAGATAFFAVKNREYTGYETVRELENSEVSDYTAADGRLIRCGTEGAQAVSADGTILWNITYGTMKNPTFAFCGDMTAIADIGATRYLLADRTGTTKTFTTPYEIQTICVARQGVTAVLMNAGKKDYIYMYDKEGRVLSEIETVVARDGFPLTIALSPDGTKLLTSYMKLEGDEPESSVTFYNFGEVGQNNIRNLVGQVQYSECLVPRLAFWENDIAVVLGDCVMELFSMKEKPASIQKKEISAEIKSIAFGEYLCMLTENREGQEVLEAYDKSGNVCMKKVITFPYVGMHTAKNEVVLYSYSGCEIYEIGKGLRYAGTFENGVKHLFVIGGNRYYLVENRRVRVIKLI